MEEEIKKIIKDLNEKGEKYRFDIVETWEPDYHNEYYKYEGLLFDRTNPQDKGRKIKIWQDVEPWFQSVEDEPWREDVEYVKLPIYKAKFIKEFSKKEENEKDL